MLSYPPTSIYRLISSFMTCPLPLKNNIQRPYQSPISTVSIPSNNTKIKAIYQAVVVARAHWSILYIHHFGANLSSRQAGLEMRTATSYLQICLSRTLTSFIPMTRYATSSVLTGFYNLSLTPIHVAKVRVSFKHPNPSRHGLLQSVLRNSPSRTSPFPPPLQLKRRSNTDIFCCLLCSIYAIHPPIFFSPLEK